MTHFQLLYCGDWWTNLLKHLFPLPPSTSLNPSLLQWEWRHGCHGSLYRQTTVIPWYTAKYLQQDSTRARTHTHKHTQRFTKAHAQASSRFSVSPFFTYARAHTHTHTSERVSGCTVYTSHVDLVIYLYITEGVVSWIGLSQWRRSGGSGAFHSVRSRSWTARAETEL